MYKINVHCISDLINAIVILFSVSTNYNHRQIPGTDWLVPMNYVYDVKCRHDQARASLNKCNATKLLGDFVILQFFHHIIVETYGCQLCVVCALVDHRKCWLV